VKKVNMFYNFSIYQFSYSTFYCIRSWTKKNRNLFKQFKKYIYKYKNRKIV